MPSKCLKMLTNAQRIFEKAMAFKGTQYMLHFHVILVYIEEIKTLATSAFAKQTYFRESEYLTWLCSKRFLDNRDFLVMAANFPNVFLKLNHIT